jgi:hypothetical protein
MRFPEIDIDGIIKIPLNTMSTIEQIARSTFSI